MLSPLVYWTVLLAVAAYAFARGRFDEWRAITICIIATIATRLVHSPLVDRFSSVELGVLVVDSLALLAFIHIALRSERFWPLWVAGLQLTTMMSHFMKAIRIDLMPQAYAAAERFWVYPIFMAIVIGTWRGHQRRLRDAA